MVDSFLTVKNEKENLIVIEKSKFICYIKRVQSEEEVKECLSAIKKKHPFATHNCYAYILDEQGITSKCSDDGEPQGTAGYPMLEALKKSGLKQVIAVCTRYFGGVKLGTGGLARAYGGSVSECIKQCEVVKFEQSVFCDFCVNYDYYKILLNTLKNENLKIIDTIFDTKVTVCIVIPRSYFDEFNKKIESVFNGEKVFEVKQQGFFAYEL